MSLQGLVAAGVVYKLLSSGSMDHDATVQATYDTLVDNVHSHATVYADHIDAGPNPRGEVDGLRHIPDLVVKSGVDNSLIVEVETADSLANRKDEALSQLRDFSTAGYRRVLVIPPSEQDEESVTAFLEREFDRINGRVYLATPTGITEYL